MELALGDKRKKTYVSHVKLGIDDSENNDRYR